MAVCGHHTVLDYLYYSVLSHLALYTRVPSPSHAHSHKLSALLLHTPPRNTPSPPHRAAESSFIDNQTYFLNATFQVTISSRNPHGNPRSILYHDLHVHMSYHDQQITAATLLPQTYQGRGGVDVWSPLVSGVSTPIAPEIGPALNRDKSNGFLKMEVKLQGQVRWRPGIFTSGSFISVDCPAYINTGSGNKGVPLWLGTVKYQLMQSCSVSL
ncbi:hypothetical protein EUGRSUZ_I02772 [Eucalyptus grandis]|uniref:Uncharacterized protein n=2 Tax=Eucalyptus grandis TaxID=71139 RepID=A0ACC3JJP2_EUCGR|nr:hypothetical protein EUGRSUZ_I02772 [Eucalyptus grandis]